MLDDGHFRHLTVLPHRDVSLPERPAQVFGSQPHSKSISLLLPQNEAASPPRVGNPSTAHRGSHHCLGNPQAYGMDESRK
ncbi:hypothetical protein AVEN_58347-1 [Araneus ventricosus]|uniref:Uncharacterized protein n=1 Tax=Araneus ventricosus TaxID=182803 RepID=A0A4Y2BBE7_ARAVE|nr:hypothetical protein AVEN_58347-1 [Araneus ventricosus]